MTESKISTPWLTSWLYIWLAIIWLTLWSTPWLTPWLTFCQSPWLTKFAMSGQFRTLAMFVQEPKTCISGELWTPNGGMVRSKQSRTGSQGAAPSLPAAPDCQTWTQKANAHCRATFWVQAFEMTNGINATMEHLMLIIWRDTWNHVVVTTIPSGNVVSPSNQKTTRFKSAQRLLTFGSRWEKDI